VAEDGLTLVELLVAISVMLIVLAGVAAGATSGLRLARGNTNRIVAANVADVQIAAVRAMEFGDIPQSTVSGTATLGAVTYTWTRRAEIIYQDAEESCEAPSGAFNVDRLSFLRIIIEVTWPRMEGVAPVRSETLIEPPVADYDPYRGHLAAKVTDRDGAPVAGVTVYLSNADTSTPATNTFDTTNDLGCVFFDNLQVISGQTVGNYYVWLNRSGWVDRASGLTNTSAQSPRPVVNVVSAQLRKVEFTYDRAAFLNVTLTGRLGGTPVNNLPVTIRNDNYNNGNGPVVFSSTALLAAQPLHPFTAGFDVWAGRCADADPGTAYRTRLATDPNVTTTGIVQMGTAQITVYRRVSGADVPVSGRTITATDLCGNLYTSAATTNGSGVATLALPYGRWTLRVQSASLRSGSSWPVLTLSPADTAVPAGSVVIQ
jgi:prepilin-type N-terminal cleavage/methylation domain-containing protein